VLTTCATDVQTPIGSSGARETRYFPAATQAVTAFAAFVRPEYRSHLATALVGAGKAEMGTNGAAFINEVRPLSPPDHGTG
jgi:hypothetical protein